MTGETMKTSEDLSELNISAVGTLGFGRGIVGEKLDIHQIPEFQEQLKEYIRPVTDETTAICMDGRERVELADGTKSGLDQEVFYQGPGGLFYPIAKAALLADAYVMRDAKDLNQAYDIMADLLINLGYKPSKHEGCLALANVQDYYENPLSVEQIYSIVSGVSSTQESDLEILQELDQKRIELLDKKYFEDWDPTRILKHVEEKHSHNHAKLKADESKTHGHYEKALVIVDKPGYGFAKDAFNPNTGMQAFGITPHIFEEVAKKIATSKEEERRIVLAFWMDLLNTANGIVDEKAELTVFK